jgi:hypothetical protein
MGVLDDAIRQHLDLKRRHGAAEEDLRKQEEEALGPARREVAPADSDDGEPTGEAALEPELSEVIAEEEPQELVVDEAVPEEPPAAPVAVEETPVADTPPQGFETLDPDELPDDDELPSDDEVPDVEELDDDELVEEDDDEDPDEDPDVLEDTPDFLQETPEHDRLWFEQKPPRDFDFD